jgi:hypothetical protein
MKGVCNLHVLLAFGVSCYWLFVCLLLSCVLVLMFYYVMLCIRGTFYDKITVRVA